MAEPEIVFLCTGNAARSVMATVLFRERPGYYAEALYANTGSNRPSANVYASADYDVRGTGQLPLNAWTHLAATYDGSVLALYVNGTQVATLFASGPIVSTTGLLKIGGNGIWGEWFNGLIDEVRIWSVERTPTDRLEHIARLAWRTLPYAFAKDGRELSGPVAFDLVAPSGARWELRPSEQPATVVTGDGAELCGVAGRRLTPDQTSLVASGPDADAVLELVRTYA